MGDLSHEPYIFRQGSGRDEVMQEELRLIRLKAEILGETAKALELSREIIDLQQKLLLKHNNLLSQISHIIEITEQFR